MTFAPTANERLTVIKSKTDSSNLSFFSFASPMESEDNNLADDEMMSEKSSKRFTFGKRVETIRNRDVSN